MSAGEGTAVVDILDRALGALDPDVHAAITAEDWIPHSPTRSTGLACSVQVRSAAAGRR
jgi:hypothetical protein